MAATQPTEAEWEEWGNAAGLGTAAPSSVLEDMEKSDMLNVLISQVETRENRLYQPNLYIPKSVGSIGTSAVTTLVVHGRDEAGDSICINAHNFYPYFYAACLHKLSDKNASELAIDIQSSVEELLDATREYHSRATYYRRVNEFRAAGNSHRLAQLKDPGPTVIAVVPETRISCFDSSHTERTFFKIVVRQPRFVYKAREIFQQENESTFALHGYSFIGYVFEAGVRFENRFMIDRKLVGGGWLGIKKCELEERPAQLQQSRARREYDVDYSVINGYSLDDPDTQGLYDRPATFRTLCYDLECPPKKPHEFPQAEEIPIIDIGTTVACLSDGLERKRTVVFMIGTSAGGLPGRRLCCYPTEREMLNDFGKYIQLFDPDIITGYNTRGFDDPYLCNRAYKCGAENLISCGRDQGVPMQMSKKKQVSRNVGDREYYEVSISGRIMYDMMAFMQDTYNPNSARLNYVARQYLNEQKDDMGYELIRPFFEKNSRTRRVLAAYCAKDAELPISLAEKLMPFTQLVELARVTGVQMKQIMGQGQTIRAKTLILREIKDTNLTLEFRPGQEKQDYEGALVAVPVPGYYQYHPIGVLDFSSLYPSIICGNNLCGYTFVPPSDWHRYAKDELFLCPAGHRYRKYDPADPTTKGILPRVLEKVLAKRKNVKGLVAAAKGKLSHAQTQQDGLTAALLLILCIALDARELALKVVANSIYGYSGKPTSVYLSYVADSTTAIGREQITMTKNALEGPFGKEIGHPYAIKCVYGDTDSVMVDFGITIDAPPDAPLVVDCTECDSSYTGCDNCTYGKIPIPAVHEAIQKVIDISHKAAEYCTRLFPPPNKLEFENVYWPWLLLKVKKRYSGPFWVNSKKPLKTKSRGLETVRGDHALVAREAQASVINYLLYRLDPDGAVDDVRRRIKDLRMGTLDMSKLVTSRKLGKGYNAMPDHERKAYIRNHGRAGYKMLCDSKGIYSTRQPHSELSHKLEERSGKGYDLGERVPFVITRSTNKKARVCDRAEDPMYALTKNIPLDIAYYLTDLLNCVVNVLAPVFEEKLKKRLHTPKISEFFKVAVKRSRRVDSRLAETQTETDSIVLPRGYAFGDLTRKMILDHPDCRGVRLYKHISTETEEDEHEFDADQSEDELQNGSDLTRRKIPIKHVTMANYAVVRKTCFGCGTSMHLTKTNAKVCLQCMPKKQEIINETLAKRDKCRETRDLAWNRCHECQSQSVRGIAQADLDIPGYTPESCKEFTCDNFFHRQKTKRNLADIEDLVSQIQKLV